MVALAGRARSATRRRIVQFTNEKVFIAESVNSPVATRVGRYDLAGRWPISPRWAIGSQRPNLVAFALASTPCRRPRSPVMSRR
ncbi:hypothetical protein HMPREF0591_0943 [Mycobacterium parascrofulaceum ATCC BAA-614]|uniref:Uncharacterized protein n=1 Tax=Mycobacterium parascrofulaceum ATCC BAA-614 TaxID=525368 RepID=D5P449_9MYCO|nr:hypothetical protein HMPREF0591_0943 [Mycobacterium parascrofulaceum ATCC BAA-614]